MHLGKNSPLFRSFSPPVSAIKKKKGSKHKRLLPFLKVTQIKNLLYPIIYQQTIFLLFYRKRKVIWYLLSLLKVLLPVYKSVLLYPALAVIYFGWIDKSLFNGRFLPDVLREYILFCFTTGFIIVKKIQKSCFATCRTAQDRIFLRIRYFYFSFVTVPFFRVLSFKNSFFLRGLHALIQTMFTQTFKLSSEFSISG